VVIHRFAFVYRALSAGHAPATGEEYYKSQWRWWSVREWGQAVAEGQ
jgi:hypothetical protein